MKVAQDRVDALPTVHGGIFAESELREVFHPHVAGEHAAQAGTGGGERGGGLAAVQGGAEHRVVHVGVAQIPGHLDPRERDETEPRVREPLELVSQGLEHDLVDASDARVVLRRLTGPRLRHYSDSMNVVSTSSTSTSGAQSTNRSTESR